MRSDALLFAHLVGALALFGGVIAMTAASFAARTRISPREIALLTKVAYRTLLLVVWPALVVAVVAGQALADKEDVSGQTWLAVAYPLTYIGGAAGSVALTLLARRVMHRAERLAAEGVEHAAELRELASARIVAVLGPVLTGVLVILFWLMTAKPGA